MKKLIALVIVMLLPLGAFAQESKIAIVYTQEVMVVMPEFIAMQKKMTDLGNQYRKDLQQSEEEYKRKYADFVAQQDSLTENIKVRRMQEIQDLEGRLQTFMQVAEDDMQKQQQTLIAPIQEKLKKAITTVGEEKGYLYIIEPGALLYLSSHIIDATPFVKTKLGL